MSDGIRRFTVTETFRTRAGLRPSEFMSTITTAEWNKVDALAVDRSVVLREGADKVTFTRTT
jgi:hypothetical protein